jgi:hypothetical protein
MSVGRSGHITSMGTGVKSIFSKIEEELRAWRYPLLVDAYPAAPIEAGHGLESRELREATRCAS